jgi:hypothetical protein
MVMEDAFRCILARLPFPVLQIHPDNGSEFFNHHMLRFWGKLVPGVTITRSRPLRKNDNPRVEQKNRTLVRAYLGHDRIDSIPQVLALNDLYDKMWIYYNFFQPVMHLVAKEVSRKDGQPTRVKRRHDQASTPFDRLCQTTAILPEHRQLLQRLRQQINPRKLREEIYEAIDDIFSLPGATAGITESVFPTLSENTERKTDIMSNLAFNRTMIQN